MKKIGCAKLVRILNQYQPPLYKLKEAVELY